MGEILIRVKAMKQSSDRDLEEARSDLMKTWEKGYNAALEAVIELIEEEDT